MSKTTRRATYWGTGIVLLHFVTNIAHAAAHLKLNVLLNRVDAAFIIAIILLCPLIAMVLLWTSRVRLGLFLLTFSMGAALLRPLSSLCRTRARPRWKSWSRSLGSHLHAHCVCTAHPGGGGHVCGYAFSFEREIEAWPTRTFPQRNLLSAAFFWSRRR
jgi:hypothetical protein